MVIRRTKKDEGGSDLTYWFPNKEDNKICNVNLLCESVKRRWGNMRAWFLKFMGLVLWGLFLFAPFIARADEGFDIFLPYDIGAIQKKQETVLFSVGGFDFRLDEKDVFKVPTGEKWSVKFNAGKDTVLSHDLPYKIQHDQTPLDDGEREAFRFGLGLNYNF